MLLKNFCNKTKVHEVKKAFLLLLVFMLISLTGCRPKETSESAVKESLLESYAYSDFFDIESSTVENFKIVKRQTVPENNSDTVWVPIDVKDEEKSAQLSYIMTYILYNDGWRLENIAQDRMSVWFFSPLQGPSEEITKKYVPENAIDVSIQNNLEESYATLTYTVEDNRYFCIIKSNMQQTFNFNHEIGAWMPGEVQTLGAQTNFSPIVGKTWVYSEDTEYEDRDTGEIISNGALLKIDDIGAGNEVTGSLTIKRVEFPYGLSISTRQSYQGGYSIDLSDAVIEFQDDSMIIREDRLNPEFAEIYAKFSPADGSSFSVTAFAKAQAMSWKDNSYVLELVHDSLKSEESENNTNALTHGDDLENQCKSLISLYFDAVEKSKFVEQDIEQCELEEIKKCFFFYSVNVVDMADGVILYAYVDADSTCDYYGRKVKQHTIEKIDYLSGHPNWFQEEFKTYFEEHQEDYEPGWLADTEEIIEVGCIAEFEDYEGESIKYDFLLARKEGEIKILRVFENNGEDHQLAFDYYEDIWK